MFDNKNDGAKYIQLYNYYKKLIMDGVLKSNDKIPSIRKCAESFELSRTTVETAYDMLGAEGYIVSKAQSGFYVSDADFSSLNRDSGIDEQKPKSLKVKYDMVKSSGDKSSFNFALWRRYVKSALRQDERLLSYGEPQGEYDLREAICSFVAKERGVVCSSSQIVVAAGTQNLIGILCAICPEIKKVSFVGSAFTQGMAVFEDYGREIESFASIADITESICNSFIYTSPSHNDNWGSVMNSRDRIKLLQLADKNRSMIIEDDYDSEFRYYTRSVPSLQGMNGGKNVVYIGTFSRLLLPSIRISFMVLPPELSDKYNERKHLYNQTASKSEQIALCQYIRDGHLQQQIKKQKKHYASKVRFVCERAKEILPSGVEFTQCQSGYLIRVTMETEKSASSAAEIVLSENVLIKPVGNEKNKALFLMSVSGFNTEHTDDMLMCIKEAYEK